MDNQQILITLEEEENPTQITPDTFQKKVPGQTYTFAHFRTMKGPNLLPLSKEDLLTKSAEEETPPIHLVAYNPKIQSIPEGILDEEILFAQDKHGINTLHKLAKVSKLPILPKSLLTEKILAKKAGPKGISTLDILTSASLSNTPPFPKGVFSHTVCLQPRKGSKNVLQWAIQTEQMHCLPESVLTYKNLTQYRVPSTEETPYNPGTKTLLLKIFEQNLQHHLPRNTIAELILQKSPLADPEKFKTQTKYLEKLEKVRKSLHQREKEKIVQELNL